MADLWSSWKDDGFKDVTPYVHWWKAVDGKDLFGPSAVLFEILRIKPFDVPRGEAETEDKLDGRKTAKPLPGYATEVPVPAGSINQDWPTVKDWLPTDKDLPHDIPEDTVIVGIIDTGIALGHRRFRRADGRTRFISAWQQTATYDQGPKQPLPFGHELFAKDIDELLWQHSGRPKNGRAKLYDRWLDEEAFNRAARLVEPHRLLGHRDLDHAWAHGTHVLDLATGFDPDTTDAEVLERRRIIAVNLPPQALHGGAGNFLGYFAYFAAQRIVDVADRLWERNNPKPQPGIAKGYPIVLNFSYGMHAGPKDGTMDLEVGLAELIRERVDKGKSPIRLVMPAGNENVERGAATEVVAPGNSLEVPWAMMPADQSSNYVEVWFRGQPDNVDVWVTPPGQDPKMVPSLELGKYTDLGDPVYARVYCLSHGDKIQLVVCVAPSLSHRDIPIAPAGLWSLKVKVAGSLPLRLSFYVQSDQSLVSHGLTGLQSFFDHRDYRTHLENGRLLDSFTYDPSNGTPSDLEGGQGPVTRKGTHNAIASAEGVSAIGGYRLTDGEPAIYSSTASGIQGYPGRPTITAIYPSDDAPSHFGLLAAGSRDGSAAAAHGTSVSTALATRDIVEAVAGWGHDPNTYLGDEAWVRGQANGYARPSHYGDVAPLKGGAGHLPMPEGAKRRVSRCGEY